MHRRRRSRTEFGLVPPDLSAMVPELLVDGSMQWKGHPGSRVPSDKTLDWLAGLWQVAVLYSTELDQL